MGTLVKLPGIVPSIAYNFILPTLFALVGICAFSIGWNLLSRDEGGRMKEEESTDQVPSFIISTSALTAGLAAAALAILLGNLGTIQLVYLKLQQIGAEGLFSWDAGFLERTVWAFRGLSMNLKGQPLAIGPGDWYWNPSRVIQPGPDNSITEFPLFTFLYSDLHAHMIVMPLALLAISWALSVVMARAKWKNRASVVLGFVIGGLIVGAIYPTNLSDSYTYLLICIIALAYSVWRYVETKSLTRRILLTLGAVAALYLLSNLLYEPYRTWYGQAYSALDPWKGPFTPITPYLIMWLVFLFILVSWMAWETHEWMAFTPLSALKRLKPYQLLIEGALVTFVFVLVYFQYNQSSTAYDGMTIAWIAFPLAAWAGVLLLNPRLDDAKRFVLFLIGTALLITIVVEVAVVRGDIGRQNTIFKFYMQVWLMFAVSSGAAIAWTLSALHKWSPGWRVFWQTAMIILVAGAALFTLTGTFGKIKDRWFPEAPRTLDSMTYMNYAQYDTNGQRLDLSEDYRAIRWMQDNVQGSPVIVEANCVEYGWCTRYTIYTGLPGVVGWNWHQRQQRVYDAIKVQSRVDQVNNFYNTTDIQSARDFLKAYAVKYIIVGGMERATYAPEGIAKFEQYNGEYWQEVYRDGSTVIYEVTP
jgi:YYY domain-containing protein